MAARTTMAALIALTRRLSGAPTNAFTRDSIAYFSDDHVQETLDQHAQALVGARLTTKAQYVDGSLVYMRYQVPYGYLEGSDSGTDRFVLRDSTGNVQAQAGWAADYVQGVVTFTADTGGAVRTLDGFTYNVFQAAAAICEEWAGGLVDAIDWSSDDQSFKESQTESKLMQRAARLRSMKSPVAVPSRVAVAKLVRTDVNPGWNRF